MNLTTYCLAVMVARDETGTTVPIRLWTPASDEDKLLCGPCPRALRDPRPGAGNRLPNHLLEAKDLA